MRYPKLCNPNAEPFDLLLHLEWRAEHYPRSPVAEKARVRTHNLTFSLAEMCSFSGLVPVS